METERNNNGVYFFGAILLIVGLMVGLRFPDTDLTFLRCRPWIAHRSILTHGILLPWLVAGFFHYRCRRLPDFLKNVLRLGIVGLCLGSTVHLGFDLFPTRWIGWALIYIPLYRWASPLFSQLWIAGSLLICPYLGCRLLRNVGELRLSLFALCLSYAFEAEQEPRILLPALLAIAVASGIAFLLPRRAVDPME